MFTTVLAKQVCLTAKRYKILSFFTQYLVKTIISVEQLKSTARQRSLAAVLHPCTVSYCKVSLTECQHCFNDINILNGTFYE